MWLTRSYPDVALQVQALPWVQDGLTKMDRNAIDELLYLDVGHLRAVVRMPFLETLESSDILAVRALADMAYEDLGLLTGFLKDPALLSGITDEQTVRIVAAGTVSNHDQSAVSQFLDPTIASVESDIASTALTPTLQISIVRTGQSEPARDTTEAVRNAVEHAEEVMGRPLPTDHVVLVLHDKAVREGSAGVNYGYAISYLPDYEQPEDAWRWRALQRGMVHEVAHYYWRGNEGWIDEGMANTLEYLYGVDVGLSPGQLKPHRRGCEAHDLRMLSASAPAPGEPEYRCSYYLGELLFRELMDSMEAEEFAAKMRDLYQVSLDEQKLHRTPSIAVVRQVFDGELDIVDRHWSGGLNAPENRAEADEGIARIYHDLIQWEEYPTVEGRYVTFTGTLLHGAQLSQPTNKKARKGGYTNFTLSPANARTYEGSILPRPGGGLEWSLDNPGDTVASIYGIDGNIFTVKFPFPRGLGTDPSTAAPQYVVIVWGFPDVSRKPTINDTVDILGYARIRSGP